MSDAQGRKEARQTVTALLGRGAVGDLRLGGALQVLEPVPIRNPQGGLHSWFVPVGAGDRLVGFAQLLPDLTLLRYSSFQRHPSSLEGCPPLAVWLDPKEILKRASAHLRRSERPQPPVLTYDREPSRLAWAVRAVSPEGTRTLFVAGEHVYEGVEPPGSEPQFGGRPPRTKKN